MAENTVEVTLKLFLEIPGDRPLAHLREHVEDALQGSTFAKKLWELGTFKEAYVERVEQRNVIYSIDE